MELALNDCYFTRLRGRIQGPFSVEQLHAIARRGRFSRQHEVSRDRMTWELASRFPELFPNPGPLKQRSKVVHASAPIEESEDNENEIPTEPVAPSEAKETQWHYARGDQQFGPCSESKLKLLATTGQLSYDDLLWTEGMQDWVNADLVPGIFPEEMQMPTDSLTVTGAASSGWQENGIQIIAPMAIASLVLGVLGGSLLFFVGSILGIIFGHIALVQIKQSEGQMAGQGLAMAGLILSYLVVLSSAVIGLVVVCQFAMRS
jgi:Domain of unknown function (DUF4190)/GYF domain 2